MGATGIYFGGRTAAEARSFMLHTLNRDILGANEKLVDYSFAKDDTDNSTEIYCAVQNVQANVIGGLVVLYKLYKEDSEIIYRYYDECEFPYHCNCPQKILKRLSSVEDLANAFKWSEESRENAEKWRKGCLAQIAEKAQKKSLKKAISKEREDGYFVIDIYGHQFGYKSLASFKLCGKILKTEHGNFHCNNAVEAKLFFQKIQKSFLAGDKILALMPAKKA